MRTTLPLTALCLLLVGCGPGGGVFSPRTIEGVAHVDADARYELCCLPNVLPNLVVKVTVRNTSPPGDSVRTSFEVTSAGGAVRGNPPTGTLHGGESISVRLEAVRCNFVEETVTIRSWFTGEPLGVGTETHRAILVVNTCPTDEPPATPVPPVATLAGAKKAENKTEALAVDADGSLRTVSAPIPDDEDVTRVWRSGLGDQLLYAYYRLGGPEGLYTAPTADPQLAQATQAVQLVPRDLGHTFLSSAGWAPDGSRVHYLLGFPSGYELYTVRPDGTDKHLIHTSAEFPGEPVWSPDSTRLARLRLGVLAVDMADGSGSVQISATASDFAWSPDGGYLAYVDGNVLRVTRPDGTGDVQVSTGVSSVGSFVWAPDGSRIAYVGDGDVFTVLPDGTGHARASSAVPSAISEVKWSPDSSAVAYTADEDTPNRLELYAAAPDGTGHRKISGALTAVGFAGVEEFEWSPDSARIAYLATQDTDNTTELYSSNADGSGNVKLSRPIGFSAAIDGFRWLPDGSTVVYHADADTDDVFELYAALADGSDEMRINEPLPPGESISNLGWWVDTSLNCPDASTFQRRIAYFVGGQPDVTLVVGTLGTDPACAGQPFANPGCGWLQLFSVDIGFYRDFELGPTTDCEE